MSPETKTPLWAWAVIILSVAVILGATGAYIYSRSGSESQNPYVPPPQNPIPPAPLVSPKLTITCFNDASVDIHIWVYVNGVEVANGILGHGWSAPSRTIELTSGGKVSTFSDLTFEKWTIPGEWYPGDMLNITYHWDGTVSYSEG